MAKDDKEKKGDDEKDDKPWTPDQPLPDADDEAETTRVAQASARRRYLEEAHLKTLENSSDPKKKKNDGKRKSLFG